MDIYVEVGVFLNIGSYLSSDNLYMKDNAGPGPESSISSTIDCRPTDTVVPGNISLPVLGSSSSTNTDHTTHALFQFQTSKDTTSTSTSGRSQHTTATDTIMSPPRGGPWARPSPLEDLRRPLRVPESLQARGLTRSQLIFSVGTSIDPRALKITGDDEFFLFMDHRAWYGWTSFGMTTQKWAASAKVYNTELEELSKKKHTTFIKKNPRALMEKLGEIEPKILDRVSRNNYACTLHVLSFSIYLY